ncbi:MAG: Na+:solute symporter, partial [Thermoguttaceae bacterium]|nr:Na+:solute symporter [Thermoguttaceae bacterium]
ESLQNKFPYVPKPGDDMAYPAMMTLLPGGIFGVVVASLFAAYMSTIATHLNLGSSYMVNDLYLRFINKDASEEKQVLFGRICTVVLMILACSAAMLLKSALDAFQILISIGAGTGLLFLLRWFWWRINAYSEIAAMCFAAPIAVYFKLCHQPLCMRIFDMPEEAFKATWHANDGIQLLISVALTTVGWLLVTFLTPPDDKETLREFVRKTRAGGPGWRKVYEDAKRDGVSLEGEADKWPVPLGILCSVVGCVSIYAALFGTGAFLYGDFALGGALTVVAVVSGGVLWACWKKMEAVAASNEPESAQELSQAE